MNTKIYLVGALLIGALLCMPVMAFSQSVTVKSQDGGLPATFSMTMASGEQTINLLIGTVEKTDGPLIEVTSNTPYTIKAADKLEGMKPAGSEGKLSSNTGAPTFTWTGNTLANAIQVGINGGSYSPLSGADTLIHSGVPGVLNGNLKFKQVVSAVDPVLPTGQVYTTNILITGAAT